VPGAGSLKRGRGTEGVCLHLPPHVFLVVLVLGLGEGGMRLGAPPGVGRRGHGPCTAAVVILRAIRSTCSWVAVLLLNCPVCRHRALLLLLVLLRIMLLWPLLLVQSWQGASYRQSAGCPQRAEGCGLPPGRHRPCLGSALGPSYRWAPALAEFPGAWGASVESSCACRGRQGRPPWVGGGQCEVGGGGAESEPGEGVEALDIQVHWLGANSSSSHSSSPLPPPPGPCLPAPLCCRRSTPPPSASVHPSAPGPNPRRAHARRRAPGASPFVRAHGCNELLGLLKLLVSAHILEG